MHRGDGVVGWTRMFVERNRSVATATRGRVAAAGAIDEAAMRDAIVKTVDGGDDAFPLRRLKYGF